MIHRGKTVGKKWNLRKLGRYSYMNSQVELDLEKFGRLGIHRINQMVELDESL